MFQLQQIKTDITAVRLCNDYILTGVGDSLHVFSRSDRNLLKKVLIFNGTKIHGINRINEKIFLYGGCYLKILNSSFETIKEDVLKDWILASCLVNDTVAVVLMGNSIQVFEKDFCLKYSVTCPQTCILYSAFIYWDQTRFVIFSGTVFGKILVWDSLGQQLLATLSGHKGAIFSVDYSESKQFLCSTSDDRTTVLWTVKNFQNICKTRVFRGHDSRIFSSKLLDDCLITGGEDSILNLWSFTGDLIRQIDSHQGAPIWALDADQNLIVTGGGDSGVLLVPISYKLRTEQLVPPEVLKKFGILNSGALVGVTESGALFYYVTITKTWVKVPCFKNERNYSVLEVSKCRNLVSVSGYNGEIWLYKEHKHNLDLLTALTTPTKSRIYAFHWLSCRLYLTCEKNFLTLWDLSYEITTFQLPDLKDNWSTTACQRGPFIYIGDRKGNLYIYTLRSQSPIRTLKKLHNHLGITKIYNFPDEVITLGRDAQVQSFTNSGRACNKLPFTWLAGYGTGKIYGFHGDYFQVWECNARRVLLQVHCSGGHRSWDFLQGETLTTFMYIRDKVLNLVQFTPEVTYPVSLIDGYHTSTINALKSLKVGNSFLLLSGGEDTTLRVLNASFTPVQSLKSHLSSIRVLRTGVVAGELLVFSGGGRGQIIVWSVQNSVCTQAFSLYEDISSESVSEVRIMDLCLDGSWLYAGTSEGKVKRYNVSRPGGYLELSFDAAFNYHRRCITKIAVLSLNDFKVLVTFSTDGLLTCWGLDQLGAPFGSVRVHQSGVNAVSYRIYEGSVVFLTGGDDAVIALTQVEILSGSVRKLQRCEEFRHCAQVTGAFLGEKWFVTAGIDQRVFVFLWEVSESGFTCALQGRYDSAIADIQGMDVTENCGDFDAFLYGKGVEFLKINKVC